MGKNQILQLSLCIPTNGIIEWVLPVLNSIYDQNVDENLFEVVITDNGLDSLLDSAIQDYLIHHKNLSYFKTEDFEFLNQITCFNKAKGLFIKFINHRSVMQPGSIEYLLNYISENKETCPITYFLTGESKKYIKLNESKSFDTFDMFVRNLSVYNSWSTGLSMWKCDMDKIPKDYKFNKFFPHTGLLHFFRSNRTFVIDNHVITKDIPVDHSKKGKYNLFYDFAVELPSILSTLVRDGDLSYKSFLLLKKDILRLIINFYYLFVVCKEPCSYDLSGVEEELQVFWGQSDLRKIHFVSYLFAVKHFCGKILRFFKIIK